MKTMIKGEVTAETILSQCIRMSNDKLFTFCDWASHTNEIRVRVMVDDWHNDPIYRELHYIDLSCSCPSLADIMSDLIKIQYDSEQENE